MERFGEQTLWEQRYADGEATEVDLDPPDAVRIIDGSGGGPLPLPSALPVNAATDMRSPIQASLEIARLRTADVDDAPDETTCYAAVSDADRRQRIEVCVDADLVLRLLRTVLESIDGFIETTTMRFE